MSVIKYRLGDHRTHTVKRPEAVAEAKDYGQADQDPTPQAANRGRVKISTDCSLKPGQLHLLSYQHTHQRTSPTVDMTIAGFQPPEVRLEKISQLGPILISMTSDDMWGDFSRHGWRKGLTFNDCKQGCYCSPTERAI